MTIKKYSVYCIVDNCVFEAEKSVQIYCWVQHSIRTFPKINQKRIHNTEMSTIKQQIHPTYKNVLIHYTHSFTMNEFNMEWRRSALLTPRLLSQQSSACFGVWNFHFFLVHIPQILYGGSVQAIWPAQYMVSKPFGSCLGTPCFKMK